MGQSGADKDVSAEIQRAQFKTWLNLANSDSTRQISTTSFTPVLNFKSVPDLWPRRPVRSQLHEYSGMHQLAHTCMMHRFFRYVAECEDAA